jgi:uncharacterized phage infection (PIP) family protein YhgE
VPVRFVASAAALAATLSFLAAGCGSSASAEEKWADSVCTSVGNWQDKVKKSADDIKSKLQSPAVGTTAAIKEDVSSAVDATKGLVSDLRSNGPPNTEGSNEAKQQLDSFATQLESTATKTREALDSLSGGTSLSELGAKLAPLAPQLEVLAASAKSTINSVSATGTKLKEGFQDADSCNRYD